VAIPVEYLRDCFDYDPETGVVRWKIRPREHFDNDRAWKIFNSQNAGRECRTKASYGYLRCTLHFEGEVRWHFVHRIAWALTTGSWPKEIDHRNGVRDDNRLSNLREATRTENHQNRAKRRDNTTGFVGVCFDRGKFNANITIHKRARHLGRYDTKEEAYAAYCAAKRVHHLFNPEAVER
jgi:hypothetical protein